MPRKQFEDDLKKLRNRFHEMGDITNSAVHKAVRSFVNHDRALAQEVINDDEKINELEIKLEKECFEIMALQQPVANDLRMVITIMKASSDLERIGDHAVSIARATIATKGETRIMDVEKALQFMSNDVKAMVDDTLTSFVLQDVKAAKKAAKEDGDVDEKYREIYKSCLEHMQADAETIVTGTEYIKVAGFLERIGDYATNICEWVVYLSTGKITEL
ncbi:MAG: phosphate signaling complex protein PhoU [Lactobacillales bacterium]|jgi:phosphate transport system protein|nr:phosphate signaling complex protein PhoU [Lactobacillales bacterium]